MNENSPKDNSHWINNEIWRSIRMTLLRRGLSFDKYNNDVFKYIKKSYNEDVINIEVEQL